MCVCVSGVIKLLNNQLLLILLMLGHFLSQMVADENITSAHYLLCRSCGHEVAEARYFLRKPSPQSKRTRNDTILGEPGVMIQLFENPQGKQFELITTSKADVFKQDEAFHQHSWFPGFLWRIVVCPRCGFHLGWSFEPPNQEHKKTDSEQTFIGLILDSLLHQDFADSLIMVPKFYKS